MLGEKNVARKGKSRRGNSVSFYWKLLWGMGGRRATANPTARQDDVDIQYPYCWAAEFMANKVVK